MKAVVMAGGEGTRLRPLTSNQPKPMVPIVGKPCMEHIIELLKAHGFEDVIVTVAFLPQSIRSYFGNGESIGANIEYSVEESPAGTAGSVRLASDYLDDTFIVISGDALCDFDLTRLVEFHKEKGSAATLALKSVENPLEFGIVVTDSDGRVERFLEKPSWSQVFSDTINTGVYVIEPEVLSHVPTDRPYDFSKELFPLLLEMGRPLYGYVVEGYWQDIGNLEQYRQANFDALDRRVRLDIPGVRLRGNVFLGEGVEIDDIERIEGPAYLGNYCRIGADATVGPYSVLSSSVTLRDRARTVASVIDASTHIGRSALIENAIIGRSCDIRSHVRIHEDVAVGDEVRIGAESVVMPGVRIFPFKEVESGSQVYENLIFEARSSPQLFGQGAVMGLVNVDLTPDTALKIAAALGTALKRGARVVASRESAPACRMIKRAMISGINSTGVNVADLRVLPASVARHLLKSHGYDAGFHVGLSSADPEVVRIQFFEHPGIEASASFQKEIEKHFSRQELRLVAAADVGAISYPARAREGYADDLLANLDQDAIRRRGFRIVVDYGYSAASFVLPLVLGPLGVEAVAAHAFTPDLPPGRRRRSGPRRPDEAPRRSRRGRPRRRLRPGGGAPLPHRRPGEGDPGRTGPAALSPPDRERRTGRQARVPGDGDEPGRAARRRQQPRGRPHPCLARRADQGGGPGRCDLRRRGRRRLRLPGVPARLRRDCEPLQAPRAPGPGRPQAVGARRGAAGLSRRAQAGAVPWAQKGSSCASSPSGSRIVTSTCRTGSRSSTSAAGRRCFPTPTSRSSTCTRRARARKCRRSWSRSCAAS